MKNDECSNCGKEAIIKMKCHFCDNGDKLCQDCAKEHRSWCEAKDDWEFPPFRKN